MMLHHTKADRRDDYYYREPTVEEKAAIKARLQARCPYDLSKVAEWTREMQIEWGYWLMDNWPDDPSSTEQTALLAACRNLEAVQCWCREFLEYAERRAIENGYTVNETTN